MFNPHLKSSAASSSLLTTLSFLKLGYRAEFHKALSQALVSFHTSPSSSVTFPSPLRPWLIIYMPTIPFPLNSRPMKSQVSTWHLYLDVSKGIFKTFKTQFVNFILRPCLPPVHLSLNTTVCPGIQVSNLGVFLNILFSLIPQFNSLSSPAVICPKHLLNVSTSFPFSLLGH